MHFVIKFVRAFRRLHKLEHSRRVLFKSAPMQPFVLQQQVCHLELENNFLPKLTIYWNPVCSGLLNNLLLFSELLNNKPPLIGVSYDKLSSKPFENRLIILALSNSILLFTLFKLDDIRASYCGVVVTLHAQLRLVDTLKLLVVIFQIVNRVPMSWVE